MASRTDTNTRDGKATAKSAELAQVIANAKERQDALRDQLYRLSNVVYLASFAIEARRTLTQVRDAAEIYPEAKSQLFALVDYPENWSACENRAWNVLDSVGAELQQMSEGLDDDDSPVGAIRAAVDGGSA